MWLWSSGTLIKLEESVDWQQLSHSSFSLPQSNAGKVDLNATAKSAHLKKIHGVCLSICWPFSTFTFFAGTTGDDGISNKLKVEPCDTVQSIEVRAPSPFTLISFTAFD